MAQGKTYLGKPQAMSQADGWEQIGSWCDKTENNLEWVVFAKNQNHSPTWKTYKVIANGRAKQKANYWFAHNKITNQIGFAKDLMVMSANRPTLHAYVLDTIGE